MTDKTTADAEAAPSLDDAKAALAALGFDADSFTAALDVEASVAQEESDAAKIAKLAELGWDYLGETSLGFTAKKYRQDVTPAEQVGASLEQLLQRVLAWEDHQTSRK